MSELTVKRYHKKSIWGNEVSEPEYFYDEQDVIKMLDDKDHEIELIRNEMLIYKKIIDESGMMNVANETKGINEVYGDLLGIRFRERGENDNHIVLQLMIEDDEVWDEKDFVISSYWIDDLIDVCERAKNKLETEASKDNWGYNFK